MTGSHLQSKHDLKSDYSMKGKVRTLVIGWGIFLVLFVATRLSAVQAALFRLAEGMNGTWLTGAVNFIVNGLWIVFIPMAVGTVVTLLKKQPFGTLTVYENGLGFMDEKTGGEQFVLYDNIVLSYGKMRQSFYVTAPEAGVKMSEYGWSEFTQPEALQANLARFGRFM